MTGEPQCLSVTPAANYWPYEEAFVQFRLLYSGNRLTASDNPKDKHAVRKEFHRQLKQLWYGNPKLRKLARVYGGVELGAHTEDEAMTAYFSRIGASFERGGFHFVPLVEKEFHLNASLDILFLRPDSHPLIQQSGDLDNRLNTLFDSLRVPGSTNGLGGRPEADEEPFFVLLEDDGLITEFKISTDTLLMLPQNRVLDEKDAFLVIDVRLAIRERTAKNSTFE